MDEIRDALHWGFIVLGATTIVLALYMVGYKRRMAIEKKWKKKKRSIYDKTNP